MINRKLLRFPGWCLLLSLLLLVASAVAYDITKSKCNFEVAVAHLDTQWNWPRDSTYRIYIPKTLHDNFALFRSYPRYKFSFCGAFRYWIAEQYGQQNTVGNFRTGDWDTLRKYVASGQWALAGSWIDETDVNIPCAEALCRNFLYGNGYYQEKFGRRSFDIYLPDCFGFGYALPTLANHFGVRGFSTQKFDLWGGWFTVPSDKSIMKWQGPDGSFIYAAMKPSAYSGSWGVDETNGDAMKAQSGMWIAYDYYGVGDKGGAPSASDVAGICNLSKGMTADSVYVFPAASDSLFRVLDSLERAGNTNIARLKTYDGELVMARHGTGCYTTHSDLKVRYRGMELAGLQAEPAACFAHKIANAAYPQKQIWRAWFKGIGHAFHDDVTGTSTMQAYYHSWDATVPDLDSQIASFNQVRDTANNAVAAVLNTLVSDAKAVPVIVYNPLGLDRRDIASVSVNLPAATPYVRVFDPAGAEVPSQIVSGAGTAAPTVIFLAAVPSTGYAVYEVQPSASPTTIQTGLSVADDGSSLENNEYIVSIDKNGDISQILDKKNGNSALFSHPHRWEFRPENVDMYTAWEIRQEDVMSKPTAYVDEQVTLKVVEKGPVRVTVEVDRKKSGSTFTHWYRLGADSAGRVVTVDNKVDWHTTGTLLKAAFYLACPNQTATYGLGVGTIERPLSGSDSRYEFPAQQWAAVGNGSYGVAVMNTYKYGWSRLSEDNLSNTLIHTPVTKSEYPGDTGMVHNFSYAIYGYRGDWRNGVEQQTQRFNLPLSAFQVPAAGASSAPKAISFVRLQDPSRAMIMAVKKAELSDNYVVRVRETAGSSSANQLIFGYNVTSAKRTNGMEDDSGSTPISPGGMNGNELAFSLGKYQLATFKVTLGDVYSGTAVRKSGTLLSSNDQAFVVSVLSGGRRYPLKFLIPGTEKVRRIFATDIRGRLVREVFNGSFRAGDRREMVWDTRDGNGVPSGVFIVTVATESTSRHQLLHLAK